MANEFRRGFSSLLSQIAKREWGLIGVQIVLGVVVPAGIGYAINLVTGDDPDVRNAGWGVLAILSIIQAILLLATLLGPSTPARAIVALDELNNAYQEQQSKYELLQNQRDSYYTSVYCANQSLGVVRGIYDSGDTSVDIATLEDHLRRILEPYVEEKSIVFNFTDVHGLYRLTVLLYDTNTEGLVQRYSYADPGIIRQNRSWTPKTGHAGRAFTEEKVIITPDLRDAKEYRDYYNELDARQYRSMASIPLFGKGGVCGVIVVTSSEPGQFNYENSVEIFETIGHILSLYLWYTDVREVTADV